MEAILGGIMGGILRLAPEFFRWLDRRSERGHELAMQDKAMEFEKIRGAQRMNEIGAESQGEWNSGALDALKEAIRAQGIKSGLPLVDALSTSVRPVITYWLMLLYCCAKTATFIAAVRAGGDILSMVPVIWTEADMGLWAGILNFWFLGRVFDRVR